MLCSLASTVGSIELHVEIGEPIGQIPGLGHYYALWPDFPAHFRALFRLFLGGLGGAIARLPPTNDGTGIGAGNEDDAIGCLRISCIRGLDERPDLSLGLTLRLLCTGGSVSGNGERDITAKVEATARIEPPRGAIKVLLCRRVSFGVGPMDSDIVVYTGARPSE